MLCNVIDSFQQKHYYNYYRASVMSILSIHTTMFPIRSNAGQRSMACYNPHRDLLCGCKV